MLHEFSYANLKESCVKWQTGKSAIWYQNNVAKKDNSLHHSPSKVKLNNNEFNSRERCGDFIPALIIIQLNPIMLCVKDGRKHLSFSW